ncbi:MAG TPA: hypothetical protein QGG47_06715 [Acidobacteriota bacterium]|nr:hypothetical protein [Acidobacteriota bacterium]
MKRPPKDQKPRNIDDFIGGAKTASPDSQPRTKSTGKRRSKDLPAPGKIRATFDLPATLHEALKRRAFEERRPMKAIVEEILIPYLDMK